jgi:hypothetical protein
VFVKLFERLGAKRSERVVFHSAGNLDRLAAYFAVFDIGLAAHRKVDNHRNLFAAVWAIEKMFHVECASFKTSRQSVRTLPQPVIPSPGRERDKLREETFCNLNQKKEGFLGKKHASE